MLIWSQTAWKVSPSATGTGALWYRYLHSLYLSTDGRVSFVEVHTVVASSLRWLLLGFQREFEHRDALRLFEILSCDHLELISQQVDRARYQERLTRKYSTGVKPKTQADGMKNSFQLNVKC